MDEQSTLQSEAGANVPAAAGGRRDVAAVRRCKTCLGTVPPPRRRYCSDWCADRGKLALQDWRRKRARATHT